MGDGAIDFLGTLGFAAEAAGVVTGDRAAGIADAFKAAFRLHRHWKPLNAPSNQHVRCP